LVACGNLRALSKSARIGVLALLLCLACERAQAPAAPAAASAPSEFDGARAFRDLEALVQLGPRPSGSAAAAAARALIRDRLRQAGWVVTPHDFEAARPDGAKVAMTNLVARRGSESRRHTMLITHYDTKNIPGVAFVGANDGASGTAVLLEVARAMGSDSPALELVFCDGEEAFGERIDAGDGLYGSRALAQRMEDDGSLARLERVILVDMVGDSDLNLVLDMASSARLRESFEAAAAKLGFPRPFDPAQAMVVTDDHSPFQERGVDTLVLLDFQYGARASPGPRWHTAGDTLEAVSADSLNRVGRTLVEMLRALPAARSEAK
jgi:glutaminyl-peptide cyclotransferase